MGLFKFSLVNYKASKMMTTLKHTCYVRVLAEENLKRRTVINTEELD